MSKRAAAEEALRKISILFETELANSTLAKPFVFGLGTGSTIAEFWPLFNEYLCRISARGVVIIPTSHQSRELVIQSQSTYPLVDPSQYPEVDCLVDGYDAADLQTGTLIKGGGGAHVFEKLIALQSSHNIYIGTKDKAFCGLQHSQVSIPVEVIPQAVPFVMKELAKIHVSTQLRLCKGGKIGPVVTDSGNLILDVNLSPDNSFWADLSTLESTLSSLTGVVGTGLFIRLAQEIIAV